MSNVPVYGMTFFLALLQISAKRGMLIDLSEAIISNVPVYGRREIYPRSCFRTGNVPIYGTGSLTICPYLLFHYGDKWSFAVFPVVDLIAFENRDVKKNVGAIHVSGRLSLMQRKVSNVLLMNAYEEMNDKDIHRIPVSDLAELVGFDSNNRECLKNSVKSLMSLVLEWNILDNKSQEKDWEAMPMLSYARIKGGYCSYSYPKALKDKLYNPEIYALISISIQRKFSSGYALTLHENLVRFRKVGSSGWIYLDALKKLLGVENNVYYRDFRRLNSKILKPAVKEVNESSDIQVEPLLQREGRQVTAVKFLITENPQLSLFRDNPTFDRLLEFGLTENQAKDVLSEHDAEYVTENLDIVERLLEAGRIKSTLAAATMDSLAGCPVRKSPTFAISRIPAAQGHISRNRLSHKIVSTTLHSVPDVSHEFAVRGLPDHV